MTEAFDYRACPVYLNCRDRVSDLRALVKWLEEAGHQRIVLVDNDSSWPDLLAYYEQTPHEVIRLRSNHGSRALWKAGLVPNEYFVYSDPDLLPVEECPKDLVDRLYQLMQEHPYVKAGPSLYLDDVPASVKSLAWERSLVAPVRTIREGAYDSLIDTTFALHRPNSRAQGPSPAIRLGAPYLVRHLPWYRLDSPTEEEQYYLEHAIKGPLGSSWAEGKQ